MTAALLLQTPVPDAKQFCHNNKPSAAMPQHIYIISDETDRANRLSEKLARSFHRPLLSPFAENAKRAFSSEARQRLQEISEKHDWCVMDIPSEILLSDPRLENIMHNSGIRFRPSILRAQHPSEDAMLAAIQNASRAWRREAPYKTILFRNLMKQCSRAASQWKMFSPEDRILVGISGGQDSLVLMHLLTILKQRLPYPIELVPATIDLGYPGFDINLVEQYCHEQGWHLQIERIPEIQDFFRKASIGDKPCPLCSRLRRGKLHGLMEKLRCNKLALGQHLDDLCVSFLMSLFRGGGLKTMSPNTIADGGKARLIRPLWDCTKAQLQEVASLFHFPVIQSCPYEKTLQESGDRYFLEQLLHQLEEHFPDIRSAMKHSMGDIRLEHLLIPHPPL